VTLRARARDDGGAYGVAMAARCGGVFTREGEELALTLPSLQQVRRRERLPRA
jgi:hypothetical protein